MIDRLVIEKGQIRSEIGSTVKTAVVHKAPVENVIEPLFIPQFVRYADVLGGIYVLEFEPTVHEITLLGAAPARMSVPVPWQVYICQPRNNIVQFFTRTEPLYSLGDVVNFPHISNMYRDGQPCGGVRVSPSPDATDLDLAISHVNYIWASTFQGGFYLSAEGAMYTGTHSIPGTSGSLLPKTMTDHMGSSLMYYHGPSGRNSASYYTWLETLTPGDLLKWEWTPAGRLIDLLPKAVQPQRALHLRVAAAASTLQPAHV